MILKSICQLNLGKLIHFPQNRDYKTYNEWFDTHACDTVFDLSNEPIEIEEF